MTITLRHDHVGITLDPDHLDATIVWYSEKLDFAVVDQLSAHGSVSTFIANGSTRIKLIAAGAETTHTIQVDPVLIGELRNLMQQVQLTGGRVPVMLGARRRGFDVVLGPQLPEDTAEYGQPLH